MDSLYIVMPAYNEEANIQAVVEEWYPLINNKEDSRLVIADTGSTDHTRSILLELKKEYPQLEILENTAKEHGPKLIALYRYAINAGADYVFQTDSDGQTNPNEFNQFWELRSSYNAIIGQRPQRGDGLIRKWVEKVVCILLYLFFGVKVSDANAPYRLISTDILKKYIDRLPNDYNIPNIMITTYFCYYKENITFRNITFAARRGGKNSINLVKIGKISWKALYDFATFRKELKHK